MIRHIPIVLLVAVAVAYCASDASAQRFRRGAVTPAPAVAPAQGSSYNYAPAYNESWGRNYSSQDWNRFYHYPYIYYPQNFYPAEYYKSSDNMYHRYPKEMRIPIYNKKFYNYYPEPKPYHQGFHYIIDIF